MMSDECGMMKPGELFHLCLCGEELDFELPIVRYTPGEFVLEAHG